MCSWHKKNSQCISCSTEYWKHFSKGYCIKCSPIINNIGIVKQWDWSQKETLKPISGFNSENFIYITTNDHLESVKIEILRQLNNRLTIYRNCFNPEGVDGMSMERLLETFSEIILKEKGIKMFHSICGKYDLLDNNTIISVIKDFNLILAQRKFKLNLTPILLNIYSDDK